MIAELWRSIFRPHPLRRDDGKPLDTTIVDTTIVDAEEEHARLRICRSTDELCAVADFAAAVAENALADFAENIDRKRHGRHH